VRIQDVDAGIGGAYPAGMSLLAAARRHLSYANVAATLALAVALSGTSYAATQLGKGEVKGKNLARSSVTSPKVKDGSLQAADFAPGQLPAGPQGPVGAQGAPGPAGPFVTSVPSGQMVSGVWAVNIAVPSGLPAGAGAWSAQSFPFPIQGTLIPHVGAPLSMPAVCHVDTATFRPAPDPGHLCVVETATSSTGSPPVTAPSVTIDDVRAPGFRLRMGAGTTAPGSYSRSGFWAATAP
jgi:hypothetical protein